MTEGDYMDDCHHADRWDEENRTEDEFEVIRGNRVVFVGTRAACWAEMQKNGGFVQPQM